MTVIHDQPVSTEPPETQYPSWAGPAGPGGPGGLAGVPGGRPAPRHPWRRRLLALGGSAGLVVALGGTAYAVSGNAGTLTTSQITAATDPGLVDVISTLGYQHGIAEGTGLVLTSTGQVLTNNHVIEGATSIKVTDVGNGRTYTAAVAGYDTSADIAVLQLRNASGLKTVTLGNSSSVAVGDSVVAIGNAGGRGGTPSAVTGKVTALGQSITATDSASGTSEQLTGMIESNASIQPGDSGGPLVNSHGQVIGIDTAGSSSFQLTSQRASTQAFAIPINTAISLAAAIEAGQASATVHIGSTAFLGVEVVPAGGGFGAFRGGAGSGVTVAGVVPGSPAAAAGLQAADQITSVAGHGVTSPTSMQDVLAGHHPGDKVTITWLDQAGGAHTATVTLATGPAA
jgi:S1-C subfamily serine protease